MLGGGGWDLSHGPAIQGRAEYLAGVVVKGDYVIRSGTEPGLVC